MKLNVKLDYACRALVSLAKRHASGELSCIDELARIEEIPANYLIQILSDLRRGGVVESRRGKQGGYLLARAPEDITLHEIMGLIQGDLFASVARGGGSSGAAVAEGWSRLQEAFESEARSITLRDLATPRDEEMYYI